MVRNRYSLWQTFVTFVLMKGLFKIFFLLLITCCYANTVFEFLDNEKKSNFDNESHCYVQQINNNNVEFTVHQNILFSDFILNTVPYYNFSAPFLSHYISPFTKRFCNPPPDKLYLLHLSFLI